MLPPWDKHYPNYILTFHLSKYRFCSGRTHTNSTALANAEDPTTRRHPWVRGLYRTVSVPRKTHTYTTRRTPTVLCLDWCLTVEKLMIHRAFHLPTRLRNMRHVEMFICCSCCRDGRPPHTAVGLAHAPLCVGADRPRKVSLVCFRHPTYSVCTHPAFHASVLTLNVSWNRNTQLRGS